MDVEILTTKQRAFLRAMSAVDFLAQNFYLSGGTALAAFHLHHRFSDDLDFFSEQEIDLLNLNLSIRRLKKTLGITAIDFQQSFNRNLFFCRFPREVLKVEFTFFPFPRLEKSSSVHGIAVDSLIDIAVNKLLTIYQRTQARDYIDVYWICQKKKYPISDLVKKAKVKFDWHIDPLQLGTQFVKATEAKDFPRLIKKIPLTQWQDFFIREAKKLKNKIIA